MYTQCPYCDAIFQLTATQLKAANGEVRCGQCLTVFSALDHLSEDIPAQTEAADAPNDATNHSESLANGQKPDNGIPDNDIFSAVVAEASQNSLVADEIDRFEEFLSTGAQPFAETETGSEKKTDAETDATPDFGDIEAVTADLNLELPIEPGAESGTEAGTKQHTDIDDEFAEFSQYQHGQDYEPAQFTNPFTTATNDDSAESDAADTDNDAIIIEEADLEPITSENYTDSLPDTANSGDLSNNVSEDIFAPSDISDPTPKQPAEAVEPAFAEITGADSIKPEAATETAAKNETTALGVPDLILEELHAAIAERLRPPTTPWIVGSLALMLALVLQVIYQSRDQLVKDADLRPVMIQMCQWTGCTLSQPYDIKQIDIIGREIRTHPTARKALIASTSLINNARFVQPFPLLTVVFSDINGKQLARRRFTPREYLGSNVDLAAGMTPDIPVRIELELVDPGKAAVNYEFHTELDPRSTRPIT